MNCRLINTIVEDDKLGEKGNALGAEGARTVRPFLVLRGKDGLATSFPRTLLVRPLSHTQRVMGREKKDQSHWR